MDIYHVWCDLAQGHSDLTFARAVEAWLGHMQENEVIAGYRLTRRKLGLGPSDIGEFHIAIEVRDLAQLDQAFSRAASRSGEDEALHHSVNHMVINARFALYRDFPDECRIEGEERF